MSVWGGQVCVVGMWRVSVWSGHVWCRDVEGECVGWVSLWGG